MIHGVARVGLAAVFAYEGLVPKLLGPDRGELGLMAATGIPASLVQPAVVGLGVLELLVAALLLVGWHWAWPSYLLMAFAIIATILVTLTEPAALRGAFNPIALNIGVLSLALVDRLSLEGIPSAGRCRRRPALENVAATQPALGTPV
jgi:uncharacterized membrane protein YphA (DoxX/SURF4 family)